MAPVRWWGLRFLLCYFLLHLVDLVRGGLRAGGGDQLADYVWALGLAGLAAVSATIWVWFESAGTGAGSRSLSAGREAVLAEALRKVVRFSLAAVLLAHGTRTMLKVDIPPPSLARLSSPIGDSSPLALYRTFMGASRLYPAFTGGAEVLAGVLLWFRLTALLGALVALGLTGNAVLLAFSYGAPEKLASLHLLLMAAIVLAPAARRLRDGLLLGRATRPVAAPPSLHRSLGRPPARPSAVRVVALAAMAALSLGAAIAARRSTTAERQPAIYGVYGVEAFRRDGRDVPLLPYDGARWRELVIASPAIVEVRRLDGSVRRYGARFGLGEVALSGAAGDAGVLTWATPAPDRLALQGTLDGQALRIGLRRVDTAYPLTAIPFRWIIDQGLNR